MAGALAEERDLDSIFHLIVDTLSSLTGADRCSLHLRDPETGLLRGQAAHAAKDIDGLVKQLVSGLPGDDFTREIIETRRPVMVTNTLVDPRPVQAAMRRWRARSVLGIPMVLRDDVVGLICLDNENATSEFTELDQELAISFAELAATAINQVQLTSKLRRSLSTQSRQLEMLQRARRMEGQLADILLRGWGVRELAETITRLLAKPCAIYDAELRCMTTTAALVQDSRGSKPTGLTDHPQVQELEGLLPGGIHYLGPQPAAGYPRRLLVTPVELNGSRQGYLVVTEAGGRFGPLDEVIVRRAAHNMALERSRSRLDDEMEWRVIESFTGGLIRGDTQDAEEVAQSLGVDLEQRRVVCVVASREPSVSVHVTPQQLAQLLTDPASPSKPLAARVGQEIAVVLSIPPSLDPSETSRWVRTRIMTVLADLGPSGELCVAISAVGQGMGHDQRAFREAQQVLRCLREHLSDAAPGLLSVEELGAARLLLASTSHDEAQQFAVDTFGQLVTDRRVKAEELLATLEAFLRLGRSVKDCADELGVHPNTVRYRLGSVERLTGLAVTTDDRDYMTAQMAMTIVRLGRPLPLSGGVVTDCAGT
ncbi:CdaR family transcriptional regulator [Nocardia nova]|uniref:CdaR family transcriptional regulator n=1 Tax=Nocardia nova TaxID=37330 RepID=A0A2S6A289_9NOCA|nr:CdaR family transcriptional regulator [Nocardia nova]